MAGEGPKASSVTPFDVARRAGVSRSAVSRAFTPSASISDGTRKKVLSAPVQLGYRVNLVARSLNKQRTDLVEKIASRMSNLHRANQIDALAKRLVREGFCPMLYCNDEEMDEEWRKSIPLKILSADPPTVFACRASRSKETDTPA